MREKTEEKRLAILRILREADGPLGSSRITERLAVMGHDISERTVRFHLLDMDRDGLTENLGRNGRAITQRGLNELDEARGFDKVGILSAKIDQMTYKMSFDLVSRTGTVVLNVSVIESDQLERCVPLIAGCVQGRLRHGQAHGPARAGRAGGSDGRPRRLRGDRNGLLHHGQRRAGRPRDPHSLAFRRAAGTPRAQTDAVRRVHQLRRHHARSPGDLHPQRHDRLRRGDADRATA